MNLRLAILVAGTVAVAAAGGLLAVVPLVQARHAAHAGPWTAPSAGLERTRRQVTSTMSRAIDDLRRHARTVELQAALSVPAGEAAARGPVADASGIATPAPLTPAMPR